MTLLGAITAIQNVLSGVTGIAAAPVYATESSPALPFVVTYPFSGTWEAPPSQYKALHSVRAEVHCSRNLLQADLEYAIPFGDLVAKALWGDPKLGGSVDTITSITYSFGWLEWNEEQHLGWRFVVSFKQMSGRP